MEILPDGSLLVSDETGDIIFRITYQQPEPSLNPAIDCTNNNRDSWISLPSLPVKLGEVSSAIIDNVLYVAGQGTVGFRGITMFVFLHADLHGFLFLLQKVIRMHLDLEIMNKNGQLLRQEFIKVIIMNQLL